MFFGSSILQNNPGFGKAQTIGLVAGLFLLIIALIPDRFLKKKKKEINENFEIITDHIIQFIHNSHKKYILEIIVFLEIVIVYFTNSINHIFPLGYAGLYILISEKISIFPWHIPSIIPFYGPGGIPFAYPPLGMIVGSFFINTLNVQPFVYLRFFPPLMGLFYSIGWYFFVRTITKSRIKGVISVFFLSTMVLVFEYHLTAAGIIRGLALMFLIWGLFWIVKSFQNDRIEKKYILLAGAFFGLTILTHLTYALFFALSLVLIALCKSQKSLNQRIAIVAIIIFIGISISAIWWVPILSEFGISIFKNVLSTHRGLDFMSKLFHPNQTINTALDIFISWGNSHWPGLTLAGIAFALLRRRWFLILWFISSFILIGEGDRFLLIIGSVLLADLLWDILILIYNNKPSKKDQIMIYFAVIFFLVFSWLASFRNIQSKEPVLNTSIIQMSEWLKKQPSKDVYLFISGSENHDLAEWLPYLSRHTPVVGHWGAEWTGNYKTQFYFWEEIGRCAKEQSLSCIEGITNELQSKPDHYIIPNSLETFIQKLESTGEWKLSFINDNFSIYSMKK
ncbi:MAG: glycosyltransferase family 39 protein [Bacteroidales bacterium]|nr:glycosyltransferase family 39 protein [Bacteroidales bacterium]